LGINEFAQYPGAGSHPNPKNLTPRALPNGEPQDVVLPLLIPPQENMHPLPLSGRTGEGRQKRAAQTAERAHGSYGPHVRRSLCPFRALGEV